MRTYCHSVIVALLVSVITTAGIVVVTRLPAQTISGDSSPVIALSVQSADNQVSGFRPGARAYYTTTISDDKGLKSVVVTTSPMMHSSSPIDMSSQCTGKTSCEEKVYIIVPSNPGTQFVTVTATDSADQVSTKTVNFDAPACTISTDCGSSGIQWVGASYCEKNGWIENRIMQYGVAAACESGICNTASLPRFKRQCQDAQVCTFDANGETLCVAQPMACSSNAQVTSACMCGGTALNYPVDWRARSPTYCCSGSDGVVSAVSPGPCPAPAPAPVFSSPSAATTTAFVPSSSSLTSSPAVFTPLTVTPVVSSPSSAASSMPSASLASTPSAVTPAIHRTSPPQRSMADMRQESQLLKSRGKQIRMKIKSIEKSIVSLEKKIDKKLHLLDQVKRAEVQKRVSVQIDEWQKKTDALEAQKEHLENTLDELRESFEQLKATAE